MRSNQTQSTLRRNAEYAENTREWQKHATVFFQTDRNLALTYWFPHLRASSAASAFLSYRTWLNGYEIGNGERVTELGRPMLTRSCSSSRVPVSHTVVAYSTPHMERHLSAVPARMCWSRKRSSTDLWPLPGRDCSLTIGVTRSHGPGVYLRPCSTCFARLCSPAAWCHAQRFSALRDPLDPTL